METINRQSVIAEGIKALSDALAAGKSEALTSYLAAMGKFHSYSFGNVMEIARQKPDATRVAGFSTWKDMGRFVKKGEKGIRILAPLVGKKKDDPEAKPAIYGFRNVYVFDVSQTDGKELPEFERASGDCGTALAGLKTFILSQGIELCEDPSIAPALGMSYGGKIALLPGQTEAEQFTCLAHEMAHELLHKGESRKTTSKQRRELEAESVAFVVSTSVGINSVTASSDYIQLYSGDRDALAESLEQISLASNAIIGGIEASSLS